MAGEEHAGAGVRAGGGGGGGGAGNAQQHGEGRRGVLPRGEELGDGQWEPARGRDGEKDWGFSCHGTAAGNSIRNFP